MQPIRTLAVFLAFSIACLLSHIKPVLAQPTTSPLIQQSGLVYLGAFKLPPEGISFEEVEKNLILQAMDQTDYNITKAAKLLGLTFRTLQYRLEKFGIKKPDGKEKEPEEE